MPINKQYKYINHKISLNKIKSSDNFGILKQRIKERKTKKSNVCISVNK
jgi:hypothetical protein